MYCPTPTIANAVIYGVLNLKQFGSITAQEAEQQISLVAVINKKIKKLQGDLQTIKEKFNDVKNINFLHRVWKVIRVFL